MKIKKAYTRNFTIVDNNVLDDSRLSLKAKGLFAYLWRQPDDWEYYESEIVKHSKDSRDGVRSGIQELEKWGYLRRKQKRENGKFSGLFWELTEYPVKENEFGNLETSNNPRMTAFLPLTENPSTEKPATGKPMSEKPKSENPTLLSTNYTKTNNTKYNHHNHAFFDSQELADRQGALEVLATIHAAPNAFQNKGFIAAKEKYGDEFLKSVALAVAKTKGTTEYRYFEKTLRNYIKKGITTPEGVRKANEEHDKLVDEFQERKERYLKNGYRQGKPKSQATGVVDFMDPERLKGM